MHKTSLPKFTIPYDDPKFKPMPNVFSFVIKPSTSTEFADTACEIDVIQQETEDCFAEHMQEVLRCELPWDVGLKSSR